MYIIGVSNVLGVEAWNSYAANYPRSIDLVVWPDISVLLTNRDTGKWLNQPPWLSRWRPYPTAVTTNIAANMWSRYIQWAPPPSYSFQIPIATNLLFLTNSTYSHQNDSFTPLTGTFERTPGSTNFYIPPYWELTLKPRLRFAMVDTGTQRIVDGLPAKHHRGHSAKRSGHVRSHLSSVPGVCGERMSLLDGAERRAGGTGPHFRHVYGG